MLYFDLIYIIQKSIKHLPKVNWGIERSVNSNLNFTIRSTIDTNMQSAVYDIRHLNFDLKDAALFYFLKLIFA